MRSAILLALAASAVAAPLDPVKRFLGLDRPSHSEPAFAPVNHRHHSHHHFSGTGFPNVIPSATATGSLPAGTGTGTGITGSVPAVPGGQGSTRKRGDRAPLHVRYWTRPQAEAAKARAAEAAVGKEGKGNYEVREPHNAGIHYRQLGTGLPSFSLNLPTETAIPTAFPTPSGGGFAFPTGGFGGGSFPTGGFGFATQTIAPVATPGATGSATSGADGSSSSSSENSWLSELEGWLSSFGKSVESKGEGKKEVVRWV